MTFRRAILAFLAGIVITTGAVFGYRQWRAELASRTPIPADVQSIELMSSRDEPITLADFRGHYTMVAFGYTHCPDVCPLTLADFRRIKLQLPEDKQDAVQFAFISVDGARDTPQVLDNYVTRYHPDFIGVTTTDDSKLDRVADAFDVYYERRKVEGAMDYVCDHTAAYFLLDPDGNIMRRYPFLTVPDEIAVEISTYL